MPNSTIMNRQPEATRIRPSKQARFAGEVERMQMLWGEELVNDPANNPNLTLSGTPFDLAFPPRNAVM